MTISTTMKTCRLNKMKTSGKIRDITLTIDGHCLLSLSVEQSIIPELGGLRDELLDITIDKHRKKRSLNANAYLWKLCDLIAQKVGSTSRENIYMQLLRDYGRFEDVLIRSEAAWSFLNMAQYSEIMYEVDGWTCVRVYQGSHDYDTKEMSILIDGAVTEAQELGIETLTPNELARMTAAWRK